MYNDLDSNAIGGAGRKFSDTRKRNPKSAVMAKLVEKINRQLDAEEQHGPIRVLFKDGKKVSE